jgi:hypothetical protein
VSLDTASTVGPGARPVSGMSVPVELKQTIGVTEGLRSGPHTKTLTFTLSTTTP